MQQSDVIAVKELLTSPGWTIISSLLKHYEDHANEEICSYLGTDPNVIKQKQMAWRCVKETRARLLADLEEIKTSLDEPTDLVVEE